MRAARYHGPSDVRIEDVPEPEAGPGEVKIAVAYNGICGTDLHEYFDGARAVPMAPHPLTGVVAPVILGHETAGHVVDVGGGVDDLGPGELVVIEPTMSCGTCRWCRLGEDNLCDRLAFHGYSTGGGGLAEFTVVPRRMVHRVPPQLSPEHAALVEPLSVAHHAVGRADVRPGTVAAVFGAGPIGIGVLLMLRAAGAGRAIVVEPAADRRAAAAALGAEVVDPGDGDPAEQIRSMTEGAGVDRSFETAGAPTSFLGAVRSTCKGGSIMLLASSRRPVEAPLGALLAAQLTVRTSYASCGDFPAVIEAVARGDCPLDDWISVIGLDDLLDAFGELRAGRGIKVLVDPRRP